MNRTFAASTIVFLSALCGCHDASLEEACQWLGACDSVDPPAEHIAVLCDNSAGSSCSQSTLDSTVTVALQHIAGRPGSRIELWTLGPDVATTEMVASFTMTRPLRNGVRAARFHRNQQINTARALLRKKSESYLRYQLPSRSPLVAALGKLSLATREVPGTWHIILVTDALEYGYGFDFECSTPDTARFRKSIENAGILTAGALDGSAVSFAFVTLGRVDGNRCPVEIGRARRIRELWASVLTAAGALRVNFESGPPRLNLGNFHDLTEQGEHP